jgi:hypothetical protein
LVSSTLGAISDLDSLAILSNDLMPSPAKFSFSKELSVAIVISEEDKLKIATIATIATIARIPYENSFFILNHLFYSIKI